MSNIFMNYEYNNTNNLFNNEYKEIDTNNFNSCLIKVENKYKLTK